MTKIADPLNGPLNGPFVQDAEELAAVYGQPGQASLLKVTAFLTPCYRRWIEASRFCILSTVGADGTDASPRGDEVPVVTIHDNKTLLMPNWRGNNRIDTLRNLVEDPRASLMFFVAGNTTVIRINGQGFVSLAADLCARFEKKGNQPRSVLVFKIQEVYPQCARALMRSQIWQDANQTEALPSIGEMLKEISRGEFDGEAYDAEWPGRAVQSLW